MVCTLFYRAKTTVTEEADLKQEQSHVKFALKQCSYKRWAFTQAARKRKQTTEETAITTSEAKLSPVFYTWKVSRRDYAERSRKRLLLHLLIRTKLSVAFWYHSKISLHLKRSQEVSTVPHNEDCEFTNIGESTRHVWGNDY